MISVEAFGRLRASDYIAEDDRAFEDAWEFLGRVWLCAGYYFTDFLATHAEPDVTRCISVSFDDLSPEAGARLLADLDLPLRPGMNLGQVQKVLGEPVSKRSYLADRVSYEFQAGEFTVDATIQQVGGLVYLIIHPPLPEAG